MGSLCLPKKTTKEKEKESKSSMGWATLTFLHSSITQVSEWMREWTKEKSRRERRKEGNEGGSTMFKDLETYQYLLNLFKKKTEKNSGMVSKYQTIQSKSFHKHVLVPYWTEMTNLMVYKPLKHYIIMLTELQWMLSTWRDLRSIESWLNNVNPCTHLTLKNNYLQLN